MEKLVYMLKVRFNVDVLLHLKEQISFYDLNDGGKIKVKGLCCVAVEANMTGQHD